MGGWDKLWHEMADAITGLGGVIRMGADVEQVIVENGAVAA